MDKRTRLYALLEHEAAGGVLLVLAAIFAMVVANSFLAPYYNYAFSIPLHISLGDIEVNKPILLWINDGLMAVFFLMVGLELKREVLEGELRQLKTAMLPLFGAAGGMIVPALIYVVINWGDAVALKGWAIPSATDIAFALGMLTLLGSRVPLSLKVFLTTLAIFDDVGAIIIIAIFYTSEIAMGPLMTALGCVLVLFLMNRGGVRGTSTYLVVGIVMWAAMLKSGVHATLAGVMLAMFIPLGSKNPEQQSPLHSLEHDLQRTVTFMILPVFAFANSGISFAGITWDFVLHPVSLGIALGLLVGKQLGIFAFCWFGIRKGWAVMPASMDMRALYGAGILCGIGFTMSLFIGSLAFESLGDAKPFDERMGILMGTIISAIIGMIWLAICLPSKKSTIDTINTAKELAP